MYFFSIKYNLAMDTEATMGIVLTNKIHHKWHKVLPPIYVYEHGYEAAIKRLILRQQIIITSGLEFTPVLLFLDGVKLKDLDIFAIGASNIRELKNIFAILQILIQRHHIPREPLFPCTWEWMNQNINQCYLKNI